MNKYSYAAEELKSLKAALEISLNATSIFNNEYTKGLQKGLNHAIELVDIRIKALNTIGVSFDEMQESISDLKKVNKINWKPFDSVPEYDKELLINTLEGYYVGILIEKDVFGNKNYIESVGIGPEMDKLDYVIGQGWLYEYMDNLMSKP